jgi:hypothetical protein
LTSNRSAPPEEHRHHREHEEDDEEDLRDPDGSRGDTKKSESARKEGDDEETAAQESVMSLLRVFRSIPWGASQCVTDALRSITGFFDAQRGT